MNDAGTSTVSVAVWDWPVRAVHWCMVLLVVILVKTGLNGGDTDMVWHMRAGETMLALVLFRILWGFVGSSNARFASFVRGPSSVVRYVHSLLRPPRELHATHNPVGGWMVVALLVTLLAQCCLGLFTHNETTVEGPLVRWISEDLSNVLSRLHRRGWWLVAALASVHVIAVAWYVVALRENIVGAMVSGTKRLSTAAAKPSGATASTPRALVLLALCAVAVWWVVTYR